MSGSGNRATPIRQPPHRQALAQAGRGDGAVREDLGGGEDLPVVVDQVQVDLVGDDRQVLLLGDPAQLADQRRRGRGAGRVVRDGHQHRGGGGALGAQPGRGLGQRRRVGHPALVTTHRHRPGRLAQDAVLRGIADPAGPGQQHRPAQRLEDREEQRLGARAGDHLPGLGHHPAPAPVARGGVEQLGHARHRAVAPVGRVPAQPLDQVGVDRDAGLAETEGDHGQPRGTTTPDLLVVASVGESVMAGPPSSRWCRRSDDATGPVMVPAPRRARPARPARPLSSPDDPVPTRRHRGH